MIRASFGKIPAGRLLIGAGALALLMSAIAGCEAGNDAPTLEFHPASGGTQTVFHGIKISNAFVLGAPSGSTVPAGQSASLFLSLYNGAGASDKLVSASASGADSVALDGGSVKLPAYTAVNLTGPQPSVVLTNLSKPLAVGGYIPVTLVFQRAGSVKLQVPVEPKSDYWSTYSPPAGPGQSATPTSTVAPTPVNTTPAPKTGDHTPTPTTSASASASS